jgi:hypothetical protein
MGDWEKFCDSNGMGMDWEPWNESGWSDDEPPVTVSEASRKEFRSNYKELRNFLIKAKCNLRLEGVKVLTRKKNGIEVCFYDPDVRIKYNHSYYREGKTFLNVKENLLTLFILYRCKVDIVKRFDLNTYSTNENIDFVDIFSLNEAGKMYIKLFNERGSTTWEHANKSLS